MDKDKAYWDSQFKFADILPDFQEWRIEFTQRSAGVTDQFTRLCYGSHSRQWIEHTDLGRASNLLPVFIHGGFWRAQEAETYRFVAQALAARFGSAANLEYRLIPEVRMAELVTDVKAGLKALLREIPLDTKLVLIGHSAGGHLSVQAINDAAIADRCTAVVSMSGLYDLEPLTRSFLQQELMLSPEEVERFSPLRQRTQTKTRFISVVGKDETEAFHTQADQFVKKFGGEQLLVSDSHHMSLLSGFFSAKTPFLDALAASLSNHQTPGEVSGYSAKVNFAT